jgi:hypothetical protein
MHIRSTFRNAMMMSIALDAMTVQLAFSCSAHRGRWSHSWVTCLEQEALPANLGGRPRPVNQDSNADIAGITAGSLAIMARLYQRFDPALAAQYLEHA